MVGFGFHSSELEVQFVPELHAAPAHGSCSYALRPLNSHSLWCCSVHVVLVVVIRGVYYGGAEAGFWVVVIVVVFGGYGCFQGCTLRGDMMVMIVVMKKRKVHTCTMSKKLVGTLMMNSGHGCKPKFKE